MKNYSKLADYAMYIAIGFALTIALVVCMPINELLQEILVVCLAIVFSFFMGVSYTLRWIVKPPAN